MKIEGEIGPYDESCDCLEILKDCKEHHLLSLISNLEYYFPKEFVAALREGRLRGEKIIIEFEEVESTKYYEVRSVANITLGGNRKIYQRRPKE